MARTLNRRELLCAAAAAAAIGCGAPAAAQKISRTLVQYQDTPKGEQSCATCLHFEAPRGCKLVDGDIDPQAWCSIFAPKPKT
jgi:hypothetical protein